MTSNSAKTGRPEPVLDEADVTRAITAGATLLLGVLVVLGLATQTEVDTLVTTLVGIGSGVVTIVNWVVPKWRAWRARNKVTPVEDLL